MAKLRLHSSGDASRPAGRGRSVTPKAVKGGAQGSPAGGGFLTRLRREKPLAVVLGSVLLLLIGVALFADVLAPFCARLTLGVGLAATAVNVLVALVVGGVSGFVGGRLDLTVQRLVDAWMSIPGLLILLTVMSVVGGAADHRGAGGAGWHRRLAGGPGRGDRRQGAGLLRGGAGGRQLALAHPAAPPAAQHRAGTDRDLQHQHRRGGDQRGFLELPGVRAADQRCRAGAAC